MSVVVRMEMPKNNCEMTVEIKGVGDWCPIMAEVCDYYSTKKMPDWCPILYSLPEGHGRLVDSEEDVSKYITIWDCNCSEFGRQTVMAVEDLQYLPTIVPAEK